MTPPWEVVHDSCRLDTCRCPPSVRLSTCIPTKLKRPQNQGAPEPQSSVAISILNGHPAAITQPPKVTGTVIRHSLACDLHLSRYFSAGAPSGE